jgi:hypothetical protein
MVGGGGIAIEIGDLWAESNEPEWDRSKLNRASRGGAGVEERRVQRQRAGLIGFFREKRKRITQSTRRDTEREREMWTLPVCQSLGVPANTEKWKIQVIN